MGESTDPNPRPASPELFAGMVIARMQKAGDQRQVDFDQDQFRLMLSENDKQVGIVNLRNLYDEFLRTSTSDRDKWWSTVMRALLQNLPPPNDFEDARPDLRPALRTRSYIETQRLAAEVEGAEPPRLPYQPVGDHLAAFVVYDLPTSIRFVQQEQFDEWGISFYEALEAARQNLDEAGFSVMSIEDRVFSPIGDDSFNASRLLLVNALQMFPIAGQLVAMVLNRDTTLITDLDDLEGLAIMADIAERYVDDPRPICSVPLRLADGEWQTWLPPPGHPHHNRFKLLELRFLAGEYAEQKTLLDRLHEAQYRDLFVASYSAVEVEGRVFSYSVWPAGAATLLPKTDEVLFYSAEPELKRRAAWDNVLRVAGNLMKAEDRYPPRWLVEEFPTEAQFAAMCAEPL